MKKRKIAAILLAALMIFGSMPVFALPTTPEEATNINSGYSSTLKNVLAEAVNGDTVVLNSNVDAARQITVKKNITIDGKGFTVNYTGNDTALSVKSELTLSDISIVSMSGNGADIENNASLTMNDATIEAGESYAIKLTGENTSVTVNSGGLKAPLYLVFGNTGASVNIYGGNFETTADSMQVRMFQMCASGIWNFYGGRYEAKRGYVFNASSNPVMNIYGGSYVCLAPSENLWNIRDDSVANFYGGYFYTPNHGSPFLVRGDKTAVMNVYGGSYFSKDGTPFAFTDAGTLNECGGTFYNCTSAVFVERFETIGNVTTQRFNIKPQRLTGASVRIDGEDASIGFSSVITEKVLDNISKIADVGTEPAFGTLLIESKKLDGIIGFDHDVLADAGLVVGIDYIDVPATEITEREDGSLVFGGAIPDLTPEDYDRDYSATSYIKFKVNGVDVYSYSLFSDGDTRNVREVARRALADNDEQGDSLYSEAEVAVLEKYISDTYEYTSNESMTAKILTLNILTHDSSLKKKADGTSQYKFYGAQGDSDYDFDSRINYVRALFDYVKPDVALLQEYSGQKYWGTQITLNTTDKSGVYESPQFPGYVWVNHGNRRGVLYENNTQQSNPFHAHNFVMFNKEKFEYLDSATLFVSKNGQRNLEDGNLRDNNTGDGYFDDLGDYTWVALRDRETGIISIYASTHIYEGSIQRYAYMLDNLQCITEELERVSAVYDGAPVVLTGDFNMRDNQAVHIQTYKHITEVANYIDSKKTGEDSGTARVYGNNIVGHDRASKNGPRIDYIFVNGADTFDYKVLDGQVAQTESGEWVYLERAPLDGTAYDISDHNPVMTQIVIGKTDAYKYAAADKDDYYYNPVAKDDTVSSQSGATASKKDSLVFDSTDLLAYITNEGQYMEAKLVEDSVLGTVLRLSATDETNNVNVTLNYKEMFNNVDISEYRTVTVKYKSVLTIKNFGGANDIKFGISTENTPLSSGTLVALDTSNGGDWATLTIDVSSLTGNINKLGIYGRSGKTGLFCGDAIYIESITFSK